MSDTVHEAAATLAAAAAAAAGAAAASTTSSAAAASAATAAAAARAASDAESGSSDGHQTNGTHTGTSTEQHQHPLAQTQQAQQQHHLLQQQPQHSGQLTPAQQQQMQKFWGEITAKLETVDDFKTHALPLARIKKVMKTDEDVKPMMISADAPIVFAKACEIFVHELTLRAWIHTEENKRRTLQRHDVAMAISKTDMLDFLIDIVPRDDVGKPSALRKTEQISPEAQYYYQMQMQTLNQYAGRSKEEQQLIYQQQLQNYQQQMQVFRQYQVAQWAAMQENGGAAAGAATGAASTAPVAAGAAGGPVGGDGTGDNAAAVAAAVAGQAAAQAAGVNGQSAEMIQFYQQYQQYLAQIAQAGGVIPGLDLSGAALVEGGASSSSSSSAAAAPKSSS